MDYNKQQIKGKLIYLFKTNKKTAFLKQSTDYLKIYKDDADIRFSRAIVYIKLKRLDEAIRDFEYIVLNFKNEQALLYLYFLYYNTYRYDEAFKLLDSLYSIPQINNISISISETVMKSKKGMPVKIKKDSKYNYLISQILSYSTTMSLNHIKDHQREGEISTFNDSLDLEYLLKTVRQSIPHSNKSITLANITSPLEVYYFSLPDVGYNTDFKCNYIKVIVVPQTDNVITIYPTNEVDNSCVNNLNYDHSKMFKEKEKVKSISRIDKFNQKYGRV